VSLIIDLDTDVQSSDREHRKSFDVNNDSQTTQMCTGFLPQRLSVEIQYHGSRSFRVQWPQKHDMRLNFLFGFSAALFTSIIPSIHGSFVKSGVSRQKLPDMPITNVVPRFESNTSRDAGTLSPGAFT
jgi:hypothetical protein